MLRIKREMLRSLETRCSEVEQNPFYALATVLDPRFKLKGFSSASSASHARMLLTTECEHILVALNLHQNIVEEISQMIAHKNTPQVG